MSDITQYGARGPLSDPPRLGEYIVVTYADHLAAVREIIPHAFNHRAESFDKPHDHLCACNMDDEPICNRSCIYCSCWRIEAARADALRPLLTAVANAKPAITDAVQVMADALNQAKEQGAIEEREAAARRVAALPFLTLSPHDGDLAREQALDAIQESS